MVECTLEESALVGGGQAEEGVRSELLAFETAVASLQEENSMLMEIVERLKGEVCASRLLRHCLGS